VLFKMNAELEWFETQAMKRAYTWEKAPSEQVALTGMRVQ